MTRKYDAKALTMHHMDHTDIANLLKLFRKKRGLTQDQLAQKLGIKRTTYASYEQDTPLPFHVRQELDKIGFSDEVGQPMYAVPAFELEIPYIGSVSASSEAHWSSPLESVQFHPVPIEMAETKRRFACRIATDSCYDLLWPGDLAVFEAARDPRIGTIILYRTEDNRVTVKQLLSNGKEYILHPLNDKYEDFTPREGSVVGYLVGIVREHGTRKVTVYDKEGIRP